MAATLPSRTKAAPKPRKSSSGISARSCFTFETHPSASIFGIVFEKRKLKKKNQQTAKTSKQPIDTHFAYFILSVYRIIRRRRRAKKLGKSDVAHRTDVVLRKITSISSDYTDARLKRLGKSRIFPSVSFDRFISPFTPSLSRRRRSSSSTACHSRLFISSLPVFPDCVTFRT